MSLKLEAAELAYALEWRYATLDEVVNWADSKIEADDNPDINLIEIAFSKNTSNALSLLRKISKDSDDWIAIRRFFRRFSSIELLSFSDSQKLSKHLFTKVAYTDDFPDDMAVFLSHWDAIDLAKGRITGKSVDDAIRDFLDDMRALAIEKF